jgi:hypothetical protein
MKYDSIAMRFVVLGLLFCGGRATALADQSLRLDIFKHAVLQDGGAAVEVALKTHCPVGNEVLEAFMYVVHNGNQSLFAGVPIACDGKLHHHRVRVAAFPDNLFAEGEAQASGFVLILDPATGETQSLSPVSTLKVK